MWQQWIENDVGIRFIMQFLWNFIDRMYRLPERDIMGTMMLIAIPAVLAASTGYLMLEIFGLAIIVLLLGSQMLYMFDVIKPKANK